MKGKTIIGVAMGIALFGSVFENVFAEQQTLCVSTDMDSNESLCSYEGYGTEISYDSPEGYACSYLVDGMDIEAEVSIIREKYNIIEEKYQTGEYEEIQIQEGILAYYDVDNLAKVIVNQGENGIDYTQYYYYDQGQLFFAYYKAVDAHRFYFYNGGLMRWRYCPDSADNDNAVNYDLYDSDSYRYWAEEVSSAGNKFLSNEVMSETVSTEDLPNAETENVEANVETDIITDQEETELLPSQDGSNLYVSENNGYYGYLNEEDDSVAIDYYFTLAEQFQYGYAIVGVENGYGLIDANGNYVILPQYEKLFWLSSTLLAYQADNDYGADFRYGMGLIDTQGNTLSEIKYSGFFWRGDYLFAKLQETFTEAKQYQVFTKDGQLLFGEGTSLPQVEYIWDNEYGIYKAKCDGTSEPNRYGFSYSGEWYCYLSSDFQILPGDAYEEAKQFQGTGYTVVAIRRDENGADTWGVISSDGSYICDLPDLNLGAAGNYYLGANAYFALAGGYSGSTGMGTTSAAALVNLSTQEAMSYQSVEFVEGTDFTIVQQEGTGLYGLYDKDQMVAECLYDSITCDFNKNMNMKRGAVVETYENLSNLTDMETHEPEYFACVQNSNDKYGFINEEGEVKIPFEWEWCMPSCWINGITIASKPAIVDYKYCTKSVLIDSEGRQIASTQYDGISWLECCGYFIASEETDDAYGNRIYNKALVNTKGEELTDFEYADFREIENDMIVVKKRTDEKRSDGSDLYHCGIIDSLGNEIIPSEYACINTDMSYYSGLIAVENEYGQWGYINFQNEVEIPFQFDYACNFVGNGLARVEINDLWGYIDLNGNFVIDVQYTSADDFTENGLALVSYEDSDENSPYYYIYIDREGNELISGVSEDGCSVSSYDSNGFATIADENGYYGLIDSKGNIKLPFQYEWIGWDGGIYIAENREGETYSLFDKNGEQLSVELDFSDWYGLQENGLCLFRGYSEDKYFKYFWVNPTTGETVLSFSAYWLPGGFYNIWS